MKNEEKQYRYPGTRPFTEDERNLFFGRRFDIEELSRQIKLEQLLVLFSKSGLGKSSLLNAGVFPKFRETGTYLPINVRFRFETDETNPSSIFLNTIYNIANPVGFENSQGLKKLIGNSEYKNVKSGFDEGFWLACKNLQMQNRGKTILLVFDQFEELFLFNEDDINRFSELLSTILFGEMPQTLQNRLYAKLNEDEDYFTTGELDDLFEKVNIKIVFSIRSDKMSLLNRLKAHIPQILQKTYELNPLSDRHAKYAMDNPAKAEGDFISNKFEYDELAKEEIIDKLTNSGTQTIETTQLQIVCRRIEEDQIKKNPVSLKNRQGKVTVNDIPDFKDIFKTFYYDSINMLDEKVQQAARTFIEDQLIKGKQRISLDEGHCKDKLGEDTDILPQLVKSHLLRCELNSLGNNSYELSHDTLVEPILEDREERVKKEEEEKKIQKKEDELRLARKEAKRIDQEKKRKLQRKVLLMVGSVAAVAIIALIVAVFFYFDATEQKKTAETQKQDVITLLKQELLSKGIEEDNLYGYFLGEAENKYKQGLYTQAINEYNRTMLLVEDEKQKLVIQTRLSEIDTIQQLLLQAGQLNSQQQYDSAKKKYENILLINPADTITPFRIEFAGMLDSGYMVEVPGGEFTMGDSINAQGDETEHRVKLSTFYMAKYEVTQKLFLNVMGWNNSGFDDNPNNPVERVDWYDAIEFCNRLSLLMGIKPFYKINKDVKDKGNTNDSDSKAYLIKTDTNANGFRLPTEAQWEYAARGGVSAGPTAYSGSDTLKNVGWYWRNSGDSTLKGEWDFDTIMENNCKTHIVGQMKKNQLDLYDMSGNVWEWCWDWYGDYKIEKDTIRNPIGAKSGSSRVLRGGGWYDYSTGCRVANRFNWDPNRRGNDVGFRVVFVP